MNSLTPGQQRLREILKSFEGRFLEVKGTGWYRDDNSAFYQLSKQVVAAFCQDQTIVNDPVTGQRLGRSISDRYLDWRCDQVNAAFQRYPVTQFQEPIRFDRFAYANYAELEQPLCGGGEKFPVTVWVLFMLSLEREANDFELDSPKNYFAKAGILDGGGNSNHRMLASALFGELWIAPLDIMVLEEDIPDDPELAQACLVMDEIQRTPGSGRHAWSEPTIESISKYRHFLLGLTKREITILQTKMDGYHDNLEKLQAALFAYRRWKRAWFGIHKWWIAAGVKKDKYIFRVLLEHFEAESMPG